MLENDSCNDDELISFDLKNSSEKIPVLALVQLCMISV